MQSMTHVELHGWHAVYIARDAEGVPLYVGYSAGVFKRLGDHQTGSPWWPQAVSVDLEWFKARADALRRERELIQYHQPEHNTQHRDPDSR